jgi:hypothetical protein
MTKLYRSAIHFHHWVAYSPVTGWTMFPARANGWSSRQPARGIDPMYLREVPVRLAFGTGLLESMESFDVAA